MASGEERKKGKPACTHCNDTGVEPGTIVISPGSGMGFNSLDPDPLDRGSYVPCTRCHCSPDFDAYRRR